jgi:anti-sigma B factor antagonist
MPNDIDTDIRFEDVNENFRRISISGRLDILGNDTIAQKFSTMSTTASKRVVVDLSNVSYLASIGIRTLITNAKALKLRGGKMVLFVGNNAVVTKVLETTRINTLIPMFADAVAADQAVLV